jgi:hypothetical protein
MNTLTPITAIQARNTALAQVSQGSKLWLETAKQYFPLTFKQGERVTGEQIRHRLDAVIGPPHHHNVWGAFVRAVIKNGLLKRAGTAYMGDVQSHGRETPVYDVL